MFLRNEREIEREGEGGGREKENLLIKKEVAVHLHQLKYYTERLLYSFDPSSIVYIHNFTPTRLNVPAVTKREFVASGVP